MLPGEDLKEHVGVRRECIRGVELVAPKSETAGP